MNYKDLIYKKCQIIPLEDLDGIITAVFITKKGVEYQVKYYLNGEPKIEYFLDFEINIKEVN